MVLSLKVSNSVGKGCRLVLPELLHTTKVVDGFNRSLEKYKANQFIKMDRPTSGKKMASVLGFTNFLRDFVPKYSEITAPLEELRNKKLINPAKWGDRVEQAWKQRWWRAFNDGGTTSMGVNFWLRQTIKR